MGKNIVILFDGTSNSIVEDRTNVLRLFGALAKGKEQVVFYDPGVGTFGMGEGVSYRWSKAVELYGLMTGWGLDRNVKEAYRFLVDHFDDGKARGDGADRLYLFGFSRGAYSARVLAGFLHTVGLVQPHQMNLLDYAYRAYKGIGTREEGDSDAGKDFAEVRLYERTLRPRRPTIEMLGLFDTVSSVIERGRGRLQLRTHAFTRKNPSVAHVRHAVALDERRSMFRPLLWEKGEKHLPNRFQPEFFVPQDVREVWFTGVHGDVGGGYPESESGLAKIPLAWMIEQAHPLGLRFKTRTVNEIVLGQHGGKYVAPDPAAPAHDSMTHIWPYIEFVPRKVTATYGRGQPSLAGYYLPRAEQRPVPADAEIHGSVDLLHSARPANGSD